MRVRPRHLPLTYTLSVFTVFIRRSAPRPRYQLVVRAQPQIRVLASVASPIVQRGERFFFLSKSPARVLIGPACFGGPQQFFLPSRLHRPGILGVGFWRRHWSPPARGPFFVFTARVLPRSFPSLVCASRAPSQFWSPAVLRLSSCCSQLTGLRCSLLGSAHLGSVRSSWLQWRVRWLRLPFPVSVLSPRELCTPLLNF
jgi:hypothetical protein